MTIVVRFLLLLAMSAPAFAQSFTATYQPAQQIRSPELRQLQASWRSNRALEQLAELLSQDFTLSEPLKIGLGECGMSNAFYNRDAKAVVLCLEMIPDLMNRMMREQGRRQDQQTINETALGALTFILFHELGHALIDIERLPVLGREEDAADMISTYLVLRVPALADRAIAGGLFTFSKSNSLLPGFFTQRHLSGEHGLNPQRAVNLACAAYGKDPQRYAWAMQAARVTDQRAARCSGEYEKLDRSMRELLRNVMR